jgi:DNA repair exonuclease SbcCD ATPase subunit
MIKFSKVRWKNFLSTGNQFIEVELDAEKTTLMVGDSGSGKSTLLDAISFGLFNKPFRNINKNQLVNSVNMKDCLVEIEFSVGPSSYLIRRGIKPNIFEIHKNGDLLDQDAAARDYQETLEKNILRCNFKSFSQIVVLGAVNFVPFMQLKTQDRRVIIEELLDLEIFSIMNTLLKKEMSGLFDEIKQKENELIIIEEKINIHKQLISSLEQEKQTDMDSKKEKVQEYRKLIELNLEQINILENKIKTKTIDENIFKKIKDDIDSLYSATAKLQLAKKQTEKELQFYQAHDNCPSCMQDIDEDFKNTIVTNKKEKLETINSNFEKVEKKLAERRTQKEQIENIQQDIEKLDREKYNLEVDIRNTKIKIQEIEEELNKTEDGSSERLQGLKDVITDLSQQIKNVEGDISSSKRKISIRDTAQILLKDSGIKSKIIKQYLPIINQHVGMFLNSMNFFVVFELNENFEESVITAGKDIFTYGNFSEGEKQRLDLALLFTWRAVARMKNSIHTNLLIMDEIFDSYLDHDATENVIELLKGELFKDTNIFVISHKSSIHDKFDKVLRFFKKKGFSEVSD